MGLNIFPETKLLTFYYGCSFEDIIRALNMLRKNKLQDILVNHDGAETTHEFCSTLYNANRNHTSQRISNLQIQSSS